MPASSAGLSGRPVVEPEVDDLTSDLAGATQPMSRSQVSGRLRTGNVPADGLMDQPLHGRGGPAEKQPRRGPSSFMGFRSAHGAQAWMLVLPVDAVMLVLPVMWFPHYVKALLGLASVGLLLLTGGGRYRARLHLSVLDELPVLLSRLLTSAALVALIFALRHDGEGVRDFLLATVLSTGLLVLGRVVTTHFIMRARNRRVVAHPTILIGGGALAAELAALLERYPRYGLALAGFVDDGQRCDASFVATHLGRLEQIEQVVRENRVDTILVAEGHFDERRLLEQVRRPHAGRCDLLVVPRLHAFHTQVGLSDHIGSIPVMRIRTPALKGFAWTVKRCFDVLASVIAMVALSPLLMACGAAVRVEGGPGVIFRQERVGRDGVAFQCLKFRSMRPASEHESATQWSIAADHRIGPVGRFMRRTSLDELPQLVNILRGEMTLVGPRPERPHFVEQFSAKYDRYAHRHRVPSGLTGLAQVSGLRGDTPIVDRARFDNYYIENWSLWLDAKVIARTLREVLFFKGK